jgi:hypothetical protein
MQHEQDGIHARLDDWSRDKAQRLADVSKALPS